MIPDHLRIRPGQEALTLAQEAEARRFAEERIRAQLSTEPVDEPEAERLLQHAYAVVNLPPPTHLHWVDGPQALGHLLPDQPELGDMLDRVSQEVLKSPLPEGRLDEVLASVEASVEASLLERVAELVADSMDERMWGDVVMAVMENLRTADATGYLAPSCTAAYWAAPRLAFYQFFDEYLTPNELGPLARFNELVAGYFLGKQQAVLVRRPRVLVRDQEGRLHSATGKCIEYHDGWGFYAWHGVRVSEQIILAPERLTREDFLKESNVEVRRVIQERMGSRFVRELGGQVIDTSPRGTLYEVPLPNDPEQVARYVQVQDATTMRQYMLRVPPTVQTAAEAVAWTFQVGVEDYHPAQET